MTRIVLILAFLVCAPAQAAGPIDVALQAGHAMFPAACSPVVVHRGLPPQAASDSSGWAWVGPEVPACELWLSDEALDGPWLMLCTMVVHEVGHLSGLKHSTDPNDVMYPIAALPSICLEQGAPPSRPRGRGFGDHALPVVLGQSRRRRGHR